MDITPGVRGAPARWAAYPTLGIQEKIPPTPREHEELADEIDVNAGNFHMFKISGWILVSPTWPAGLGPADHL